MVPAITDGIFLAHSGSRASPLRVLLPLMYRWFGFGDHSHRLVAGQPRISLLRDPPPLAPEAALKWQHWRWQGRGTHVQMLAFDG
jgi:hypothetical protein